MKKRLFSLLTSLFMVISMVGVLPAVTASALTYGDYEYAVNSNGTVKITSYNGNASTLSIPSTINGKTVTSIGEWAFEYCTSLESITIPNSVTSIGKWAFEYCTSLESITIPNSVKSIGKYAFEDCSSLTSITIPNSVTSIGDYAFRECESLTSITIPNSVTSIGDDAFYECTSLTSITIPNSVTSIGEYAFARCDSLKSVTIPNSVINIGYRAFNNCDSLTSINVDSNNKNYLSTNGVLFNKNKTELIQYPIGNTRTSYTIPNSVTIIGEDAFRGCTSLTSITIPNSVTSIGGGAFYDCDSLTSITIPNSVTSIGQYAFYNCDSLTSITIPNSVTSIGKYAFAFCYSLTSITVDSNNKNYSSANGVLFNKNKTELIQYPIGNTRTSYTIPNSVTSIGKYAFSFCTSLTSITIPNSVTSIGDYAFRSCRSLTSVTIPTSVKSVGNSAFRYCYNIKNVYYKGSQAQWKNISFGDNNKSLKTANVHFAVATITVPTVTGLKVAATSAQAVKLTCNKVSGAAGYVFYRAVSGKWQRVGVSKTNTFTDTKLKAGTSYRYAVKAYKTVGGKNYYSASYPTLWTSTNPATVSFTLTAGSKKVVAKWTKTTGATGYKVYYKTSAKGKWVGLTTTKSLTYTKTGLVKGKTYWFTVKAYRTANGKTYNGAFVTKSVKVK